MRLPQSEQACHASTTRPSSHPTPPPAFPFCLPPQLKKMIADVDREGTGTVDFTSFLSVMTGKMVRGAV